MSCPLIMLCFRLYMHNLSRDLPDFMMRVELRCLLCASGHFCSVAIITKAEYCLVVNSADKMYYMGAQKQVVTCLLRKMDVLA